MTRKQVNDVWLICSLRAGFRHWAHDDFKNDPDRMRTFVVAVMQKSGMRAAGKVYDRISVYLNSKSREEIAEEIMKHPDLIAIWAGNPIWKQVGISPPWTEH